MKEVAVKRDCDGCDACCQGWLYGEAYGHKFWPGSPCHFKTKVGCKIYEHRPEDPCKTFTCAWLSDSEGLFPEWMKPNLSNVLITLRKRSTADSRYFRICETGQNIDSRVLSWIHLNLVMKGHQVAVQIHGGWVYYGSQDFVEEMTKNPTEKDKEKT